MTTKTTAIDTMIAEHDAFVALRDALNAYGVDLEANEAILEALNKWAGTVCKLRLAS